MIGVTMVGNDWCFLPPQAIDYLDKQDARDAEIYCALKDGESPREIAKRLRVSIRTVAEVIKEMKYD